MLSNRKTNIEKLRTKIGPMWDEMLKNPKTKHKIDDLMSGTNRPGIFSVMKTMLLMGGLAASGIKLWEKYKSPFLDYLNKTYAHQIQKLSKVNNQQQQQTNEIPTNEEVLKLKAELDVSKGELEELKKKQKTELDMIIKEKITATENHLKLFISDLQKKIKEQEDITEAHKKDLEAEKKKLNQEIHDVQDKKQTEIQQIKAEKDKEIKRVNEERDMEIQRVKEDNTKKIQQVRETHQGYKTKVEEARIKTLEVRGAYDKQHDQDKQQIKMLDEENQKNKQLIIKNQDDNQKKEKEYEIKLTSLKTETDEHKKRREELEAIQKKLEKEKKECDETSFYIKTESDKIRKKFDECQADRQKEKETCQAESKKHEKNYQATQTSLTECEKHKKLNDDELKIKIQRIEDLTEQITNMSQQLEKKDVIARILRLVSEFQAVMNAQNKISVMKSNNESVYKFVLMAATPRRQNYDQKLYDTNRKKIENIIKIASYLPWDIANMKKYVELLHDYKLLENTNQFLSFFNQLKAKNKSLTDKEVILNTNEDLLFKFEKYKENTQTITDEYERFNNLYEDFLSAVRIYLRLNKFNVNEDWKKIILINTKTEELTYEANIINEQQPQQNPLSENKTNPKHQKQSQQNNPQTEKKLQESIQSHQQQTITPVNLLKVNDLYSVAMAESNRQLYAGLKYDPSASLKWENKPLQGVFSQLGSGYNVFLFGYGYSGSGKTYTLFGKNDLENPGLVQIGLGELIKQGYSVQPTCAFDIYGQTKLYSKLSSLTKSVVIQYYPSKDLDMFNKTTGIKVLKNTTDMNEKKYDFSSNDNMEVEKNINSFLKDINEVRKKAFDTKTEFFGPVKCVKTTINNIESSRGHLFVVFEIINNNNGQQKKDKNYFVAVDMAGIESPFKIIEASYNIRNKNNTINKTIRDRLIQVLSDKENTNMIFQNNDNILEYSGVQIKTESKKVNKPVTIYEIKPFKELLKENLLNYFEERDIEFAMGELNNTDHIKNTIFEGVFINETINHLKWFLLKKRERLNKIQYQKCGHSDTSVDSMSDISVCDYSTSYDSTRNFYNPESNEGKNKVLIVKIIEQFMDDQKTTNKPAKFIMMSVLNTSRVYEQNIYETCENQTCDYMYECENKDKCKLKGSATQVKFGYETLDFLKQLLDAKTS